MDDIRSGYEDLVENGFGGEWRGKTAAKTERDKLMVSIAGIRIYDAVSRKSTGHGWLAGGRIEIGPGSR
jgi:hypothetical protein